VECNANATQTIRSGETGRKSPANKSTNTPNFSASNRPSRASKADGRQRDLSRHQDRIFIEHATRYRVALAERVAIKSQRYLVIANEHLAYHSRPSDNRTTQGQQPGNFVSDTASATPQPKKKRRFGRPDVPRPLAGLDMRSQEAKVFLARLDEVTREFPYGEPSRLREIAGLRVALEQTQVEVLKGNARAREDLVRISNLIARREGEMQTRRAVAAPPTPGLSAYLASKRGVAK
jgi:hypothetical protein